MTAFKSVGLFFLFVLVSLTSSAGIVPYTRGLLKTPDDLSTRPYVNTLSGEFTTEITPVWSGLSYSDRSKKGVITFGINHHFPTTSPNFRAEVKVVLTKYATLSSSGIVDTITLQISNYPEDSLTFIDKQSYVFDNVEKFDVKLILAKLEGYDQTYLRENLYIQGDVYVDRVYDFTGQLATPVTINSLYTDEPLDLNCDDQADEFVISWDPVEGAEEYQLEWLYINNYDKVIGDLSVDFRLNSTRISTSQANYHLSLVFDKGYICYRVRAVGRSMTDVSRFIFTPWSTNDGLVAVSSCDYYQQTTPYDVLKNWQYSSTYAEEGKKKEVVSFFDGSLRNRQMVTKINSDNTTIVGETIYDYQGRPAIQVLPVPVAPTDCETPDAENSLKFYEKFNRKNATDAYTKLDFDTSSMIDSCSTILGPMHPSSGASNYYSSSNPDTDGIQGYLPDAQQFPFSQVEYTPDNTGRISRQGGVGAEFQLGSGHETKYFYGHPFQEQLDRLFGSEVGDYAHYQKNMVIDPNGQVSVSYLDQEGRVIATSLAGEAPDNLISLESAGEAGPLTVDLLSPNAQGESSSNVLGINGRSKVFNQTILLSSKTTLQIDYDLNVTPFIDTCLSMDSSVCFNCVYDLKIEVRDMCGVLVSPQAVSNKLSGRFELDTTNQVIFKTDCANFGFDTTFVIDSLAVGSYQISKILTINEAAIEAYVAMYVNDSINMCKPGYDEILEEVQSTIDNDCSDDFSCAECIENLGPLLDYIANGGTEDSYNLEVVACNAPCTPISYYETMRMLLKGDVMPSGQYAQYDNASVIQTWMYPLSVLNVSNILPKSPNSDWKHPKYDIESTILNHYYDEDGITISRIYLQDVVISSNIVTSSLPIIDVGSTIGTHVFLDALTNTYYTYPEYLTGVADFIGYYGSNLQWANSLVYYHPEYPILKYYRTLTTEVTVGDRFTSEGFDAAMMRVNTWDDAITAGFIKSTYSTESINNRIENFLTDTTHTVWDPAGFYDTPLYRLQNKVANFITINGVNYSMMQFAGIITRCSNLQLGAYPSSACTLWGDDYGLDSTENQVKRDESWMAFRSLYFSAKQKILQDLVTDVTINDSEYYGYNACIGNDEFNPFENGFFNATFLAGFFYTTAGQFTNVNQPCSFYRMAFYQNKEIRFGTPNRVSDLSANEIAYQQYLVTGQCPNAASLQSVLNEVAFTNQLDDASFSLNSLNSLSGLLLSLNNFDEQTANQNLNWVQTTINSNILEAVWSDIGLAAFATLRLVKDPLDTLGYSWSQIIGFSNLYFTELSSGIYEFTALAKVQISGLIYYVPVTGTTTLPIGNCQFEDVCEKNDLGNEMQHLLQAITAFDLLGSTTAFNLSTEDAFDPFVTNNIQHAVSLSSPGNLSWIFDPAIPGFKITNAANSDYLRLGINSFSPSIFTISNMNLIDAIDELVVGPNNTFDLVCNDAYGNYLVTISLDAVRVTSGGLQSIELGDCGLPTPLLCDGEPYRNLEDLKAVFQDVLVNQNAPFDLYNSLELTSSLETQLNAPGGVLTGTVSSLFAGAKRLRFNLPTDYCDLTLNYDSIPGVNFSFDSIVSVDELEVSGETNSFGSNNSFDLTVNFSSGGTIHTAVLKGISCLNLKECISCTGDITVSYTASQLDSIDSVYLNMGVLTGTSTMGDYHYYCDLVDTFNVHHGLTILDPNYVPKLSYYEFFNQVPPNSIGEFAYYLNAFVDSVDAYFLLQSPSQFYTYFGTFNSVKLQYGRYLSAVDFYNTHRDGIILDQISPVTLVEFTTTIYSGDCSNYISYLLGNFTNPGTTLSVLSYPNTGIALIPSDSCFVNYQTYVDAYLGHIDNNPSCYMQQFGPTQLVSYIQFLNLNLCCTEEGEDALAVYLQYLYTNPGCELIPPSMTNCMTPEEDFVYCSGRYNNYYLTGIDMFNTSDWAIANNISLTNEFASDTAFIDAGFCECAKFYQSYLFTYIYAQSTDVLPNPITISEYCASDLPDLHPECSEAYQKYLGCVALYNSKAMANESEDVITYVISEQVFYQENLCNCVNDYCAELNLVSDGLKEFDLMPNILTFCSGDQVIPCPNDSINIAAEPFVIEFNDPCEEFYQANTENTAYIAYQEQTQAMQTDISQRYIQHCLGALENLSMTYNEIEHHFTLYYYDQAGNLIKTVPPEGVEFIDIDNSTIKAAILSDRANNTHQIVTSHRMQTTYLYNSLNQLVAQNMPDQDEMQVFESTLPNGLPTQLSTTAIQMVSSNQGYLTGFMTNSNAPMGSRGYLFSTNNGGQNWVRVSNTIASDLKRVRMINSNSGLAVGTSGILLLTQDGGATWDLVDTYSSNIQEDFVSLEVSTTDGYALTRSGQIFKCTTAGVISSHAVAPTNTSYTATAFTDFSLQNNYSTTTGILYVASLTDGSSDFDAIILNNGSSVFTLEKVLASDLNALAFYSSSEGAVAGLDGNLSLLSGTSSSDFVQTMQVSGTLGMIDQIQMLNGQIGIARIEENGQKVIRTTKNGGKTWLSLSNEYLDANLVFIKRSGTTTLEVLIQGYTTGSAYSKTVLLASNGTISELNQTPTAVQNINLKVVYAYNDGIKITVFGIDSANKLYRSNAYLPSGTTLQFTEITDAGTITDAKQLLVLKDGTDLLVHALLTTGTLKQSSYSLTTQTASSFATVSGATALVWMDKITASSTDYVLGYNSSDTKIYAKTATGSLSGLTTTLSLGTSVITKLAVHGTQVTLAGTNGGIFTSGSISTLPSSVTFYARQDHRLPALNSIQKGASNLLITGQNGLFISRAISTSATTATVKPLHTLSDLYAANEFVSSSISYYLVGGTDGFLSQFKVSNLDETTLYTTAGLTVKDHSNNITFYDIAVATKAVYAVGGNGSVYYTPDITTDLLIPTVPATTQNLRSVCFNGSLKAIVAGSAATLIRYNSQTGSLNNRIFSSRYRDVHFANGQFGTLIGDHFLVRTTTDGGLSWKINLPTSALTLNSSTIDNLRKVWTVKEANTSHFALIGGYGDYLTVVNNGLFAATPITGRISDIQFSKNSPLIGYLSINSTANGIRKITLTPSTLLGYTLSLSADVATSTDLIHAIHVFENQSVAYVGGSGKINFYNSGGLGSSYTLATISGATFRDVYFHDDVTGYAVGDAGKWYHLSSNSNDATTHAILSGGLITSQQIITDPEIGTATDYNILAMAFNSRTTGVYGGYYTNGTYITTKKAMVRALRHEGGMFTARFYYDRLGRIVTSQNSRQLQASKFSYTLYDELGRVYEAGEKTENGSGDPKFGSIFGTNVGGITVPSVVDDTKLETWLSTNATTTRKEVTRSYYDATNTHIESSLPIMLTEATQRKRIVHVTYEAVYDDLDEVYDHATHYDYDVHGNVKTLLQENQLVGAISGIDQHRFKRMDYVYDLISGNVHRVDYETGNADQWHHAYNYDADNRITEVYTTKETPLLDINSTVASMQNEPEINPMWDQEASYEYYQHGPLARTTLADQEVQGIDYVYTLQGWIKGVNSNGLDAAKDPGRDGDGVSDNKLVARDVFGYSLHYYAGDYAPIVGGNNDFIANQGSSDLTDTSSDLYNGNIGRMVTTITDPNSRHILPLGNAYQYDQLNRLKQAKSFNNYDEGTNAWGSGGTTMYYNAFTYDANGNIETQVRQNDAGTTIDDLTYNYHDLAGKRLRNRLYGVNDPTSNGAFADDIDNMVFDSAQSTINQNNNYVYDAEGRLVKDLQEEIDTIVWRVDGKVKFILRPASSAKKTVSFDYDAMGHRIAKHSYTSNNSYLLEKSTYYILDVQGNTMSVYERVVDNTEESVAFFQAEKHIYGSSRLGMHNEPVPMLGSQNTTYTMEYVDHRIGERTYELSNHLGNVLSVISDKIIPHDDGSGNVDYWLADIRQSTDYSPFGVTLENRNFTLTGAEKMRYAFNGMEKDDEIKGEGNSYDFGARMLDPRLGRWLTIDPSAVKYPANSPYHFALNSPLLFNDPNGKDAVITISEPDAFGVRTITLTSKVYITGIGKTNKEIKEFAKSLQFNWDAFYSKDFVFPATAGLKYDLNIQVEFIAATTDNLGALPAVMRDYVNSDQSRSVGTKAEGAEDINGKPSGLEYGENVITIGWGGINATGTSTSQAWINDKESPVFSAIHEMWHLLGLSDRYDAKFQKPRIPHTGYEYNNKTLKGFIMAGTGYEIGQANIDAIIQSCINILNNPVNKIGNLFTIYKSIINDITLDELDPNKKKAVIEKSKDEVLPE
ncbi:RHS repeat-associated core domain-containing protein [Fluviicola taffensis]|uniref:RHS repeat-associated core domain protein n=1 Tax=Fluviicola taffensis (strain DSM 16823 / NCIMB 13979 / RW262) TaxID=755732 RepID=F2IEX4_FLUTR|nr:RHS repeat-associated core domain-containing protein [Fluviicola taffensis]AEA42439.1 RHS repeat-associated core domain protein [Fluviicola taffensis DSM 16823]